MLSARDNQTITSTNAGTPLGEAFRRYWMPALLSEELPEPDGAPVRVGLLGEQLIAFRDTSGRVGIVANACPHRGASMFFGRNEENGLRCVYHGWKFDADGACVDMPNEPAESNFKHKIRLTAYPTHEGGGLVWAYMGPAEKQPPLPDFEWLRLPEGHRTMTKTLEDCNYLQGIEGGIDSSHTSFLHRMMSPDNKVFGANSMRARSTAPKLEVVTTPWGYTYASLRGLPAEHKTYVRVYQFVMPFYQVRAFEGFETGRPTVMGHMWVPVTDETHWVYNFMYRTDGSRLTDYEILHEGADFGRDESDLIPGTFRLKANRSNDYLIDRAAQKSVNYTGIMGINTQDMAIQESMGPVYDRSKEHLGTADTAIIAARRLLLQAAADVAEGRDPQGAFCEHIDRSAEAVIPDTADGFQTLKPETATRF